MPALITYERYTELLVLRTHHTITPFELADLTQFEAEQPRFCHKCNDVLRSFLIPSQIVHDAEKCTGKAGVPSVSTTKPA